MKVTFRFRIASAAVAAILLFGLISSGANPQSTEKLGNREIKTLIAGARTSGDHERLSAYYRAEAESLISKQREHEEEFKEYAKDTSRYPSKYPTMGDHCRELSGFYGMAAKKALALADMHAQIAKDVRSNDAAPK